MATKAAGAQKAQPGRLRFGQEEAALLAGFPVPSTRQAQKGQEDNRSGLSTWSFHVSAGVAEGSARPGDRMCWTCWVVLRAGPALPWDATTMKYCSKAHAHPTLWLLTWFFTLEWFSSDNQGSFVD